MPFEDVIKEVAEGIAQEKSKRARLKDLDLIVLDNSIRESTVGQLRGHTLENKWNIFLCLFLIKSYMSNDSK